MSKIIQNDPKNGELCKLNETFMGQQLKTMEDIFFNDHRFTKFNGFLSWGQKLSKMIHKTANYANLTNFYGSTIKDNGRHFFYSSKMPQNDPKIIFYCSRIKRIKQKIL